MLYWDGRSDWKPNEEAIFRQVGTFNDAIVERIGLGIQITASRRPTVSSLPVRGYSAGRLPKAESQPFWKKQKTPSFLSLFRILTDPVS
jgi:hypothetical protein